MIERPHDSEHLKRQKYVHIIACHGSMRDACTHEFGLTIILRLCQIELIKGPDVFPRHEMANAGIPIHEFDAAHQYFQMFATCEALPERIQGEMLKCVGSGQALFNWVQ